MAANVTVTGQTGPGLTVTAGVFPNCSSFSVDTENEILTIVQDSTPIKFAITSATTFTVTISGSTYTVSIS